MSNKYCYYLLYIEIEGKILLGMKVILLFKRVWKPLGSMTSKVRDGAETTELLFYDMVIVWTGWRLTFYSKPFSVSRTLLFMTGLNFLSLFIFWHKSCWQWRISNSRFLGPSFSPATGHIVSMFPVACRLLNIIQGNR